MWEELLSKPRSRLVPERLLLDNPSEQVQHDQALQAPFFADRLLVKLEQLDRCSASCRPDRIKHNARRSCRCIPDKIVDQPAAAELSEGLVPAPASSVSGLTPDGLRMLWAIEDLPEDEREVFDLVRIQGMTQAETAQLLGVSTVTVKRRLSRGLRLLAEQLADLCPGEKPPGSI